MFRLPLLKFLMVSLCCLPFFSSTVSAFQVESSSPASSPSLPSKTHTMNRTAVVASGQREVINIVIDKMEGGLIYSKDGRTFEISSTTRVIDNANPATAMRTAELVFQNSSLIAVVIK